MNAPLVLRVIAPVTEPPVRGSPPSAAIASPALVEAAFLIAAEIGLPRAIATITSGPAAMCHLTDRGRLAAGLRADLVRIGRYGAMPVVRQVWRGGARVI
jgi:alpha-D-ribose 1-methylphosphonate 5-triphosphate diphosphatase PhnM